MHYEELLM